MRKIYHFLNKIFKRKSLIILEEAIDKISEKVNQRAFDRILLKKEINAFVKSKCGLNKNSDFIPSKRFSKVVVLQIVNAKFGDRMNKLNIGIKQDLTLYNK